LARLRELVPAAHAVVGIDLADRVQSIVVTDHDSRVLARCRVTRRAWELGPVLDWADQQAQAAGFTGVSVACEPTGHRWRVVTQLAGQKQMPMVCVQPLLVARGREAEDYTRDKTDEKDAVLIARLATELRCYQPEQADPAWARLRHLGLRRVRLISDLTACRHQLRDLLECCWPAVLATAAQPLDSITWQACLAVVLAGCEGDPARLRGWGLAEFTRAVRAELPHWGGKRLCRRILAAVWAALADPTGVLDQRPGGLERAGLVLADAHHARAGVALVQAHMLGVLQELGLSSLLASIDGLSLVAAAAVLAQSGDPARFRSPRAMVKHAGLNPQQNTSGTLRGKSTISKRGRPQLRTAAWRAAWGAMSGNAVLAARYQYLTSREDNRLAGLQAHVACAAALLRWIHVVVTRRVPWDSVTAAGGRAMTGVSAVV
jgi:transposase